MADEKQKVVKVKAARIDPERGLFMGIDELLPEELTADHLPSITECDLAPGSARWDKDKKTFVQLPKEQRVINAAPTMEVAIAFDMLSREATLPETSKLWLDGLMVTVDLKPYLKTPLVAAFIAKRKGA